MRWKKVSIIGVGLLGGSLGQALRKRKLAGQVVGCVRRQATINEAKLAQAVDSATLDFSEAAKNADLIVLCTPIAQMREALQKLLPHLKRGAIVTDVGSVKASVMRELEPLATKHGVHFVGSHPMAGSERMGVSAARPDLYLDAACVVTPTKKSNPKAVLAVESLWRSVGSHVIRLTPAKHDELVARSSHLPHLLASQLVNFTLTNNSPNQSLLCATGFRDTTRIASGSSEMWRDIALANRGQLSKTLRQFTRDLLKLQKLVQAGDKKALGQFFKRAKQRRDAWCNKAGYASPE